MLYHLSIDADNPRHVADVVAELWRGVAKPFPPVAQGSWIAMAGDDRNTCVEVYPRGTELHARDGDADAFGMAAQGNAYSATHFAMATMLGEEEVRTIAEREGWPVKYRKRGDAFGVLELWIEGSRMVEVLTPPMQQEYLETMTISGWSETLAAKPRDTVLP